MMSSRQKRFKRSLVTALTALALAISGGMTARDASAAEEAPEPSKARSEEAAAAAGDPAGSGVEKKAAALKKKARAAAKKKKDEAARAGGKKKAKKAPVEKEAKKGSAIAALSRPVDHSPEHDIRAESEKGRTVAAAAKKKDKAKKGAERGDETPAAQAHKKDEKVAGKADKKADKKGDKKSAKVTAKKKKRTASRSNSSPARRSEGGAAKKNKKSHPSDGDKEAPRKARNAPPKPCFGPAVTLDRSGLEGERFPLVMCNGKPIDEARERLSLLARPWGVARPELRPAPKTTTSKTTSNNNNKTKNARPLDPLEVAPGIRRVDAGLLARIDAIARKFPDRPISVVSGYRPQSRGSLHQTARAIDLRVAGVPNDDLVAFCKTLPDTGCGYYPNSSFVHVDVRHPGTGSVTWIDASGPGEPPRYVTQWPPPPEPSPNPAFVPPEPAREPATEPASAPDPAAEADEATGKETDPAEASEILGPTADRRAAEPAFQAPSY
ncbi:MAG: D-Ala-D-Ala carboxypeptidase family metallohydrolase [Polyangiaceae bacterium]|nr:D-Ala-D-Ala carboxypeptidase family metallohydrolase [Polyangiaceae bacterium]